MNTMEKRTASPEIGTNARADLAAFADQCPFLQGLKPEQLEVLSDCAMRTRFNAGDVIFHQGDPANRFYLILSGRVVLESTTPGHSALHIQTLRKGDVLGWSWLFPPFRWQFAARAVEQTETIFLYGTRLREHCEHDHDLGYELMRRIAEVVIRRLQATRRQLSDVRGIY